MKKILIMATKWIVSQSYAASCFCTFSLTADPYFIFRFTIFILVANNVYDNRMASLYTQL